MLQIKGFRIPKGFKCKACGRMTYVETLCERCRDIVLEGKDHFLKNQRYSGKGRLSFSIEFETDDHGSSFYEQFAALMRYGYVPCEDSSIQGWEWKSPIYRSFRPFVKHCRVLDELSYIVTASCGTHIHVGTFNRDEYWEKRHRIYSILAPLAEYLYENDKRTIKVWGRYFNTYATMEDDGRYTWVNVETSTGKTIEWRLPRWRNSKQFYPLLRWIVDITPRIVKAALDNRYPCDSVGYRVLEAYKRFEEAQLERLGSGFVWG